MNSYESSPWFWLLIIGGLATLAVLPTLVAMLRRVDSLTTIILFNTIGCATFVGWPAALVLAFAMPRRTQKTGLPFSTRQFPPT
ncbi:Superinfection immunity protein [Thermomonospora echinospora]|uniref:Superinfection immunity protein n=1 Tax=Thermomonospora echinospora TaxID=1992 RepID=A0A1H5USN2_9ACTN|nr:superinfection immunity protein [Thermomonospora echinospora]SEF78095.1 Superinfection immunity protein [Thermomonospora echinospora]